MTTIGTTSRRPIAVVGATGLQGGATARALLGANVPVRALARRTDSDAARALTELGADLVAADLDDPEGLRAAFTGVDGVFAMTTPGPDQRTDLEVTHGQAIADAAAAAGVPHVVYSSVGGAERHTGIPHFDSKREVEEYLVARGLSTTFVRPVFFVDNFAQFMTPTMEDGTLMVRIPLPPGIPLQMITAEDVGAVAAAAALDPDRVPGGSIEIAGDELTGEQIAEAYQHRYDVPARYEPLPIEVLGDDADQRAMFEWLTHLPAYQADFAATKALAPRTKTLGQWLSTRPDL
ncbi:MAG TPA: NmrA/HSCARG family protein [Kribbella sp.]|uniref:NmrA/HSCARG family protein n=1 Tax=Kribbella sp. TaxID=1871183 RepID=UPI002D79FBD2|nr:NmrA/HSCARG family protein [Kribbella sp.]HET6298110.1 NmrA/HSCARG family protein [Kribbella sp.]